MLLPYILCHSDAFMSDVVNTLADDSAIKQQPTKLVALGQYTSNVVWSSHA
jgi:hypothetical protein